MLRNYFSFCFRHFNAFFFLKECLFLKIYTEIVTDGISCLGFVLN